MSRFVAVLAAVVIAAVVSLAVPAAAERAAASDDTAGSAQARNGDFVFSGTGSELYLMRPDGTRLRRLTGNRAREAFPRWSPDGRWILYVSDRSRPGDGRAWEIYVMRSNGRGLRRVTRNHWSEGQVAWAPSGKRIVFSSNRPPGAGLWSMNLDGTGLRRLTANGSDLNPDWSPDGRTIAFARPSASGPSYALWLISPDGTNERQLTEPPHFDDRRYATDFQPEWSPDGRRIAFSRLYLDRSLRPGLAVADIYAIRPDGTGLRRLTRQAGRHDWPAWSPDAKRIAFVTTLGRRQSIDAMNADGTRQKRITTGRSYAYLDWQPLR